MSTQALADAVKVALADVSAPLFDTEATGSVDAPWVVFLCGLPEASERSLAGRTQARNGYVRVTCTAGTGEGARILGDEVDDALEGASFAVTGWTLGPVRLLNVRTPEADFQAELTNGRHPVFQVLEYRFTANRS